MDNSENDILKKANSGNKINQKIKTETDDSERGQSWKAKMETR